MISQIILHAISLGVCVCVCDCTYVNQDIEKLIFFILEYAFIIFDISYFDCANVFWQKQVELVGFLCTRCPFSIKIPADIKEQGRCSLSRRIFIKLRMPSGNSRSLTCENITGRSGRFQMTRIQSMCNLIKIPFTVNNYNVYHPVMSLWIKFYFLMKVSVFMQFLGLGWGLVSSIIHCILHCTSPLSEQQRKQRHGLMCNNHNGINRNQFCFQLLWFS